MIAQYYKGEDFIRIFPDHNSTKIFDIPTKNNIKQTIKEFGFPVLKDWEKLSWGYELSFKIEVTQTKE